MAKHLRRLPVMQNNRQISTEICSTGSGHTCSQSIRCHLVRCQNRFSGFHYSSVALLQCLQDASHRISLNRFHLHLHLVWDQEVVVLLHEQPAWATAMFGSSQRFATDASI